MVLLSNNDRFDKIFLCTIWHFSVITRIMFLFFFSYLSSSRVGPPPPFLREPPPPPFLGTHSLRSKFKKLPLSFWEPSKLVHVNRKKHFKMKVTFRTILCQLRISVTLLFLLLGSTLYLLLTLPLARYCL